MPQQPKSEAPTANDQPFLRPGELYVFPKECGDEWGGIWELKGPAPSEGMRRYNAYIICCVAVCHEQPLAAYLGYAPSVPEDFLMFNARHLDRAALLGVPHPQDPELLKELQRIRPRFQKAMEAVRAFTRFAEDTSRGGFRRNKEGELRLIELSAVCDKYEPQTTMIRDFMRAHTRFVDIVPALCGVTMADIAPLLAEEAKKRLAQAEKKKAKPARSQASKGK